MAMDLGLNIVWKKIQKKIATHAWSSMTLENMQILSFVLQTIIVDDNERCNTFIWGGTSKKTLIPISYSHYLKGQIFAWHIIVHINPVLILM
jgi:hypothetical protein